MIIQNLIAAPAVVNVSATEMHKRQSRWRFFQIVFLLMYLGVVLDIITTALGVVKAGSHYEQNPLGGSLIGGLGWIGLFVLLTILCGVCYLSFRTVFWRMALGWSMLLNTVTVFVTLFRWLAVVTAVMYLAQ